VQAFLQQAVHSLRRWDNQGHHFARIENDLTVLGNSTVVEKLSERRFRDYWDRTANQPHERLGWILDRAY
jgi:hypothetical protein